MPSAISPNVSPLPRWSRPAKTKEQLQWTDIKVIDLTDFDKPGVKERLAEDLRSAVRHPGCLIRLF
jgi:5S rRNA maturation endonuclease (ribonuclease M5)